MKDKTILIADDHPMIRHGLRKTIESHEGWQIVAEADDGNQAFELICKLRPAITILDISMPGRNGFEVVRALRQERIETSVIFLTMYRDENFFKQALDLEVRGYVLKESAVMDVLTALKTVAQGEHYTSPALTSYLIKSRAARPDATQEHGLGVHLLSPAERRVLDLIAEYKTSKDIAEELNTSPRTVETHRTNIAQKLGLHGRHALMKFALEHKSSE